MKNLGYLYVIFFQIAVLKIYLKPNYEKYYSSYIFSTIPY